MTRHGDTYTCDGCDREIDGLPWRAVLDPEHATDHEPIHHVCSPDCAVDYARRHMEGAS